MNRVRRLRLSLASRILAFQLAIILGALLVGAIVSIVVERQRLDAQYEKRALTIAQSVAGMPSVANAIKHATGARLFELPARPARVLEAIRSSSI